MIWYIDGMKISLFMSYSVIPVMMVISGCGKPSTPATASPPVDPPQKGSIQTAIDGFTGKTAVDAGRRAKDQIKAASEARNRNLEEMGQ